MIEKFKIAQNTWSDRNVKASVEQIKQQTYNNNIENKKKINELIDEIGTNETSTNAEIRDIKDRLDTDEGNIGDNASDISDLNDALESVTTYSTTETIVGKWINDKPLYRKVYSIGALPNASAKTEDTDLTDFNVVKLYGFCVASDNTTLPLPYVASSNGYNICLSINSSNQISVDTCTTDRSGYDGTIILEYIKTTD